MWVRRLEVYHFYEREWADWESLRRAFAWEIPERFNIAEYVCDRWAGSGRVAVYGEHEDGRRETYTFGRLRRETNRLANYLRGEGVGRGDRVGVNTPQRAETLIAHVACWKLGAVSVPLSTLFGPDALAYRLGDAGTVAAVVDDSSIDAFREARSEVTGVETVVTVGVAATERGEVGWLDALDGMSGEFGVVETGPDDAAIILYTSGTTGAPKGVLHGHRVLLGHLPLFVTTFSNNALEPGDVYWTPSEWAWIASVFAVACPALFYGKPVVAYNGGAFDPEAAFGVIDRYGVTNVFAPPTALRMMRQASRAGFGLESVRCIASGGEAVGEDVVAWAEEAFDGAVVNEGYGQTEANVLIGECNALGVACAGTMGKPGLGHEVAILDPETGAPTVGPGEVGEIGVRVAGDPVCFAGYWNTPGATARKIRDGWLLTEDLGRIDEDGYVRFEGRKDDVIISAGYRIGPAEIEACLAGHAAVADAAVIGVLDEERGEVPKAFVVLVDGRSGTDELRAELRGYVRERLAKYEYPRSIEFVDDLPTTSTGKIRRQSLREREGRNR